MKTATVVSTVVNDFGGLDYTVRSGRVVRMAIEDAGSRVIVFRNKNLLVEWQIFVPEGAPASVFDAVMEAALRS